MTFVPLASLRLHGSPRLNGESEEHIRALVETDARLPPILVHRPTMCVVDGVHRVRAARLRGEELVEARFCDGHPADVFVMAVRENVAHGLPLSLDDRKAAAGRIVLLHPTWSDRAIAEVTGLSHKTVAKVRRTIGDTCAEPEVRVGRDGYSRPVAGRRREAAQQVLLSHPGLPLREVARRAGVSVGTAHSARRHLREGGDDRPETGALPVHASDVKPRGEPAPPERQVDGAGGELWSDPSLRLTNGGRMLLRLLRLGLIDTEHWNQLAAVVPPHRVGTVAAMARSCSAAWAHFAGLLDGVDTKAGG